VLTSHGQLGSSGQPTGFWLEELASPYYILKDAGFDLVLASPKGGPSPIDPKSEEPSYQTEYTKRFKADPEAMKAVSSTKKLAEIDEGQFVGIFYPGGHGPLYDLANDSQNFWLLEKFSRARKPIAAVCHGPAAFRKTPSIVKGFAVTGFSNAEEAQVGMDKLIPFALEDMLKENGARFTCGPAWTPHVITDNNGLLITGQNPASAAGVALELVKTLRG